MIKCFSIVLLLSSVCILAILSCKSSKKKTLEAERFEKSLTRAKIQIDDGCRFIVWNSTSCGGCRDFSIRQLLSISNKEQIKLIVPIAYCNEAKAIDKAHVFIDSFRVFDEFYFGIDNVGIVNVYNNEVLDIKNYKANEMDMLKNDLRK